MDAFSKETYEKIRVGGVYEDALNNALQFLKILKSQRANKMIFEVQFSIMEENQHELEAFNKFWSKKGACVKNRPKVSWTGRIKAPNLDPLKKRVPCKWALSHAAILWDGSLVACGGDSEGVFIAGNVGVSAIREIWNTTHEKFRQIHLEKRWHDLPDPCKGCLDWQTAGRTYINPEKNAKSHSTKTDIKRLDSYKDAYIKEAAFYDENMLILSWFSKKVIQTVKDNAFKNLISLGVGHRVVSTAIIKELAISLDKYLIIEGSKDIIEAFKNSFK